MSFKKVAHFLTLSDTEELEELSSYDHNLIYASLARQLLSFLFSFSVFMYGTTMFLPFIYALIVSLLVAGTLFTIDQAIIGSEWSLQFDFFNKPWVNYLANTVLLPIRLLPRIAFSVSIALFIATIAEISIQHKAIDEVLQKETVDLNKEYFRRLKSKENILNADIESQKKLIDSLSLKVSNKRDLLSKYNDDMSPVDEKSIDESVKIEASNLDNRRTRLSRNSEEIKKNNAELLRAENLFDFWEQEKALELTPERGARKGVRWNKANRKTIDFGQEIGKIKANIKKLNSYHSSYYDQVQSAIKKTNKAKFYKKSIGNDSLKDLESKLDEENKKYIIRTDLMKKEMNLYQTSLKNDGIYFEMKNGPLGRYIALNKLYNDPNYGEAAKEFSYGLKLVIILIELSPVIVMVFFSPYSFYAQRMRAKKHAVENTIPTVKMKSDVKESEEQEALREKEEKQRRDRKYTETFDKKFDEKFDEEFSD